MCYSSQIAAAHHQYLKLTGATIDLDQFREVYGFRHPESSIRIAPAVDRWFDEPKNADERTIKEFIDRHRIQAVVRLEGEIFVQRKRLADAERRLRTKPTKAAGESRRIAGDKIEAALARLSRLKATQPHPDDARIFPMHHAPIVIQDVERRVVRLARYHCRQAGTPASVDRKFPGLYNARRDNLEKFWRREFGHNHAMSHVMKPGLWRSQRRIVRNEPCTTPARMSATLTVARTGGTRNAMHAIAGDVDREDEPPGQGSRRIDHLTFAFPSVPCIANQSRDSHGTGTVARRRTFARLRSYHARVRRYLL